jgi:NADPH2:quinone reductase
MAGNISLTGFSLAALAANDPARVAATLDQTLDRLASGALTLRVTVLDGLAGAADAQQALAERRGSAKYVAHLAS